MTALSPPPAPAAAFDPSAGGRDDRNHGVALFISVPVTAFRLPQAREYLETGAVPPPSTIYGMLLSLVGETNRLAHIGSEVGIGLISEPARSTVLRTVWRVKDARVAPGMGSNRRPDFQELLTDVRLVVFARQGLEEQASPSLAERLALALADPATVRRFGGLSLGESTHLVDEVRLLRAEDAATCRLLVADPEGDLPLPIWADHVGSAGTRWGQFALRDVERDGTAPEGPLFRLPAEAWVSVTPPT